MVDDRRPGPGGREEEIDDSQSAADAADATDWSSWSNLWQVPAIAASALAIVIGLFVAMRRAPDNDFAGAFDRIEQMIAAEEFDTAAAQLNEIIEPNLHLAEPPEQARFDAVVADWIALSQKASGLDLEENNRRIVEHYAKAADQEYELEPARLERWAFAFVALGDIDKAEVILEELDRQAGTAGAGLELRRQRNRVLRGIVEHGLRARELSYDDMERLLSGYRADPSLAPGDELWAIARQAELRLEDGKPKDAVTHLLIDMRRFEPKLAGEPRLNFGELYALLARAYWELGETEYAAYHVDQALSNLTKTHPARGDALVLLGRIAIAEGDWHQAFEHFDEVVRDFQTTRSAAPALLGRAEVYSVLGDDDRALADYRLLGRRLAESGPRRDVTPDLVARSLGDRHDAALTMGRLETALEYIVLAETFFDAGHVPAEIQFRIASTSRQLADNLVAAAREDPDGRTRSLDQLDPKVRYQANEHYRRAGDYYISHARTVAGRPGEDQSWADSLWLAADSYDLGGWTNLAIEHFTEYVSGRSEADPRRPDAMFRLAQAHHAELDYEAAASRYEQVIAEHPRSHVASRSHVPLARCLLALGRRPEAEQQMLEVVSGQRHLEPESLDYRDALIELGTLYYQDDDYARAIQRLHEAVGRYPDDDRINEVRFYLADAYRRRAGEIEQELSYPTRTPVERQQLEKERSEHLRTASALFDEIVTNQDGSAAAPAHEIPEHLLRYAYLYRADCTFALGEYDRAVELYDQVADRFPSHHSSMTALIQIVNCYSNLGDDARAATAHRRALIRLRELPDEAFEAPDSLLDRAAWERWLENMPAGTRTASAAS